MTTTHEISKTKTVEISQENEKVFLKVLGPKKVQKYYRFESLESAIAYKDELIKRQNAWDQAKIDRKARKQERLTTFMSALKIGDIFDSSWGYDQTNIDFYMLVGLKGKKATFVQIGSKQAKESNHWGVSYVVANPDSIVGEPFTKIINDETINLTSYSHMRKWDGHIMTETSYA